MILVDTSAWIEWLIGSPTGERLAYLSSWQSLEGPTMALRLFSDSASLPVWPSGSPVRPWAG